MTVRTVDGADSGIIGAPPAAPAPPPPGPTLAEATQHGGIPDLPLPQLPADLPPIEPPEFVLARKEYEDTNGSVIGAPHAPGLGGGAAPDTSGAIRPAAFGDDSSLLGAAHGALNGAQGVLDNTHTAAQGVLDNAQSALSQAPAGLGGGAAAAIQQAGSPAAAAAAAAPAVPPLPADPIGALMNGVALPALPGVDLLFKPFLDLLSSFGTGVLGALNPTTILSQSSQVIQAAMQVGQGAMKAVEQVWEGQSARAAQAAAQQTQVHGQDTSQRGIDISKLTEEAAAVVQRGNVQLTAVANAFAAEATALAPVIFTPPAQATLIASATEHLGTAVGIVNATRAELAGYTGQLSGVVQQLLGSAGGPNPAEVAQAVAQNVGQPIMEQAQQLLSGGGIDTQAAGLGGGTDLAGSNLGASTHAASYGGNGAHAGSYGGSSGGAGGFGGVFGRGGAGGSGGSGSIGSKPGAGSGLPGARGLLGGMPGIPFGPGMPGTPGQSGAAGSGFMGAPAAAAQRRDEDEHARNVQPYQSPTGNSDLTGALGETTPEVIGQTHSDEIINDYEMDQL
ncbi:hypothetical protein NDR87_12700 [Nocardia sp. CDC159]|uniref:Uncharacterized protein n=1 Tax=Nocardia pulmonis TaxID=2951408 RepID=A0A9X2EAU4_9NOCA|nr:MULTISPECIES: hypothetical protein [Nocardia]MCM6774718.1 hypothetical protein [Nocardia pulmonis]MCM6787217.1 hypothetical protein [Nocardia sp. CDC159]